MLSQEEIARIADEITSLFEMRKTAPAEVPKPLQRSVTEPQQSAQPMQQPEVREAQPAVKSEGGNILHQKEEEKKQLEEVAGNIPESDAEPDRRQPLLTDPADPDALRRMMSKTTARIGVSHAGPRLKTQTMLKLRMDHAAARDAVMMDVSEELIDRLGLLFTKTKCEDKNTYLTRPDLGRDFDDETKKLITDSCKHDIDVQLIVSDGLSSSAIEANAERILPVITEGLKERGISVGTPIFVKFGRVAAQDRISELLNATIVCSLIGERPGLATAESMSAYISYKATVGMPEARRTVVSNIHKDGVPAVEAGAYIVDLLALILEKKASGVELQK